MKFNSNLVVLICKEFFTFVQTYLILQPPPITPELQSPRTKNKEQRSTIKTLQPLKFNNIQKKFINLKGVIT